MPGLLITFEGNEGSGKTTLIRATAEALQRDYQISTVETREPGGLLLSEKIRDLLLHYPMNPWTELFLYEAARAEHLHQVLLPALKKNQWVLCDRFTDSTLAYQGAGRGLNWDQVKELNLLATQGLTPHLSVFLDIPPQLGLKNATEKNRFEEEKVGFHQKVRQGFLKSIRQEPQRWIQLKALSDSPQNMASGLIQTLKTRFPQSFRKKRSPTSPKKRSTRE